MNTIRLQEYILEAIDQLRRRKARPDMNRICNYLFRRHSISCKETATALEKLVNAEIVIKVDYKGCTSYRNAAKWSMLSYYKSKQEHDFVTTLVCRTVAELILLEPNYLDDGVPYEVLGKHVSRKDKRFTKQYFNYILENELESGSLRKLSNGNYFVGDITAAGQSVRSESPFLKQFAASSSMDMESSSILNSDEYIPSTSSARKNDQKEKEAFGQFIRKKKKSKKTKSHLPTPIKAIHESADCLFVNDRAPPDEISDPVIIENPTKEKELEPPAEKADVKSLPILNRKIKKEPEVTDVPDMTGYSDIEDAGTLLECSNSQEIAASEPERVSSDSKRVDIVDLNLSGRRKRSKKIVFDPSDNNLPKVKRCKKGKPLPNKISPPGSKHSSPSKQARKISCDLLERIKKIDQNNTSSIFQPVCGICDFSEKRIGGVPDSFISCTDCITKVHQKCFESTKAAGSLFKVDLTNWQCSNCKTCSVCEDSAEVDKLIICYVCDEAFHAVCHDTVSNSRTKISKDQERWFCSNCFLASQLEATNVFKSPPPITYLPTEDKKGGKSFINLNDTESENQTGVLDEEKIQINSEKQPLLKQEHTSLSVNYSRGDTDSESADPKDSVNIESCFNDPFEGHPIDESVPDATQWSSEDVYKYFIKYFQPSIAEIFKKQEIDGISLLLMKRYDILSGFDLKLGPALKIYGHVRRLQIRRTAPQLLWV